LQDDWSKGKTAKQGRWKCRSKRDRFLASRSDNSHNQQWDLRLYSFMDERRKRWTIACVMRKTWWTTFVFLFYRVPVP
jgi:hypothetical protein